MSNIESNPEYADPCNPNRMVQFLIELSDGSKKKEWTNRPDILKDSINRLGMYGDGITVIKMYIINSSPKKGSL